MARDGECGAGLGVAAWQANLKLRGAAHGHLGSAHIVVEEDEPGVAAGANGRARNREIGGAAGLNGGSLDDHGRQIGSKIVEKVVEDLQLA